MIITVTKTEHNTSLFAMKSTCIHEFKQLTQTTVSSNIFARNVKQTANSSPCWFNNMSLPLSTNRKKERIPQWVVWRVCISIHLWSLVFRNYIYTTTNLPIYEYRLSCFSMLKVNVYVNICLFVKFWSSLETANALIFFTIRCQRIVLSFINGEVLGLCNMNK